MKRLLCFILVLSYSLAVPAQIITGIATKWNDDFIDWTIFTDEESVEGEITMRWPMQRNWTDWEYELGDVNGSIRLKWPNDPNQWDINGNDDLVTARTIWKGNYSEWRITNNSKTITLKSRWSNNFNEWRVKEDKHGAFEIKANWEGDPREWIVEDYVDEDISTSMKVAILFLVTFHSSPKED